MSHRPVPLAVSRPESDRYRRSLRRGADMLVGLVLLVVALPAIAVVALAVRAGSAGPVLRRERALGPDGQPVELLRFRTTLDGAESGAARRLRDLMGDADGPPMTRTGRLLRRTRADRLPWLYNVVVGDASLFRR